MSRSIKHHFLPGEESEKDQTLVANNIGVVRVLLENPLKEMGEMAAGQGAGNRGRFCEDSYKGRNSVNGYSENFEDSLHELEKIPTSNYSMDNPLFKAYVTNNWSFKLYQKMLQEVCLKDGKGGVVRFEAVGTKDTVIENEHALALTLARADFFNNEEKKSRCIGEDLTDAEEKNCIMVYSNDSLMAFVNARTILFPVKGLEQTDILYDWKVSQLNLEEKRRFVAWLDQLLSDHADDFLFNLIRAVKVTVGADQITDTDSIQFTDRVIKKGLSVLPVPAPLSCVKGLFRKAELGCKLEAVEMTDVLSLVPCTTSIEKPGMTQTVESRLLGRSRLVLNKKAYDSDEIETYEALLPFMKKGCESLVEQKLIYIGGSVTEGNDACKVVLHLRHAVTHIDYAIEKVYDAAHIRWLTSFPHVFAKNYIPNSYNEAVQTDLYAFFVADDPCSPDMRVVKKVEDDQPISIMCEESEVLRIPEMYYRSEDTTHKKYHRYCLKAMPDMLSFSYSEGGVEKELGALCIKEHSDQQHKNSDVAILGFDMGTANSVVAIRDCRTDEIKMVDFIQKDHFMSITSIPQQQALPIEKTYRLSSAYDEKKKCKVRTALMAYPDGIGAAGIHKDGTFMNVCGATMNLLEAEKKELEHPGYCYLKTDIKFGESNRNDILTFLREITFPIIAEQIAMGKGEIQINASYPNEELNEPVKNAWSSLMVEMKQWPMVAANKVKIHPLKLWTEAVAVANYTLNKPNVMAATHIGFASVDIGDGTSDISVFSPSADGAKFEFKNQMSLKYAGDDILIDTLVHMYAPKKQSSDRYQEVYGQEPDEAFANIWVNDNSTEFTNQVNRCEELLNQVEVSEEMYRDGKNHETLRNELLTLIEDYGIDLNHISPKTKALLILRYAVLFYIVSCYLETVLGENMVDGTFPIYLYGGGSKGLKLLGEEGTEFGNTPVGVLFRNMIAEKIGCDPAFIEIVMQSEADKNEVACGMVQDKNPILPGFTIQKVTNTAEKDPWWGDDDDFIEEEETEKLTVQEEVAQINGKDKKESYLVDFIKTLLKANRQSDCSKLLFGKEESAWLYTVIQSAGLNKKVKPKDTSNCCYVSSTENIRILSALHSTRERRFGSNKSIPQDMKLRYHAARMVDQYLIKMCAKTCKD
ncbi:MAG: hypothetical protein MJ117_07750 [Lachnospiraceae bacterium]|nr:hypothetical protein [Lachnospiraceae bacterium]